MRLSKLNAGVDNRSLRFGDKVLLLAGCAMLVPWLLALALVPPTVAAWLGLIGVAISLGALKAIRDLVHPVSAAADLLGEHLGPDGAADQAPDEMQRVLRGVAELARRSSALQHRWARQHPLTKLPTREPMVAEIGRDLQADAPATLLGAIRLADYDRLSAFDSGVAEEALRTFAQRIAAAVGGGRPLAHVDRDSFVIWYRGADVEQATTALQALRYALSEEIVAGDMRVVPDVEVGAAIYPVDAGDPSALIGRALVSLAKAGSQDLKFDSQRSANVARERFALEQDLRQAIAREELDLHFQPVVDLAAGALVGAEALLRWRHPVAGLVAPNRFIPILEDANLAAEIGMWTLNAACREARGWERRGIAGLKVAVNLSATQLRDADLKLMIERTLVRHQLKPAALELELTETAATEDAERTLALFTQLRRTGISLAIDDFGSGYSSLSYLKNLPFDKLKIDREFVTQVHRRRDSQAICRSLIALTRGLGLTLLAEGVETIEEVEWLRQSGCSLFQGFYFSKPLPGDEFVRRAVDPAWLASLRSPARRVQQEISNRMTA